MSVDPRDETTLEHIARDMREGRFPRRSPRQAVGAPPVPMIPILGFTPGELRRERVTLGAEEIGEIIGQGGGLVAYRVHLHSVRSAFRAATSIAIAREAIERDVNEWLIRLGVLFPGLGVELRIGAGE